MALKQMWLTYKKDNKRINKIILIILNNGNLLTGSNDIYNRQLERWIKLLEEWFVTWMTLEQYICVIADLPKIIFAIKYLHGYNPIFKYIKI